MAQAGKLAALGDDMARVAALLARATTSARIVAALLLVAVVTMAVGRYV